MMADDAKWQEHGIGLQAKQVFILKLTSLL